MTLIEIIERVEAATGPDRELDAEIACLLVDGRSEISRHPSAKSGMVKTRYLSGRTGTWIASRYTSSVDDAMDLVPAGWNVSMHWDSRDYPSVAADLERDFGRGGLFRAQAHGPNSQARALCAAALRARLAMEKSA